MFNNLNIFKKSNSYNLNTSFSFEESIDKVWDKITRIEEWSSQWDGVDHIENLHLSDSLEGNSYKSVIKGKTPYTLSFYSFIDKVIPGSMISTKVNGDLEGEGVCFFSEKNNRTDINFKWNVRPTKLWMKILSPLARLYFVKNHDKIMEKGIKGLLRTLKQSEGVA